MGTHAIENYFTSGEAGAIGVIELESVESAQVFGNASIYGYPVSGDHIRVLGEEMCRH
jgi:hypothetical protein